MPIVQLFCAPDTDVAVRLSDTAAVLSQTLGLPDDAVIASHVPVTLTVRPGHGLVEQVVVVVHSSVRDTGAVEAARAALQRLADGWTDGEPAWISWQERA